MGAKGRRDRLTGVSATSAPAGAKLPNHSDVIPSVANRPPGQTAPKKTNRLALSALESLCEAVVELLEVNDSAASQDNTSTPRTVAPPDPRWPRRRLARQTETRDKWWRRDLHIAIDQALAAGKLSRGQAAVLRSVMSFSGDRGQDVTAGQRTIAKAGGWRSDRTVRRHLRQLEQIGFAAVEHRVERSPDGRCRQLTNITRLLLPGYAADRRSARKGAGRTTPAGTRPAAPPPRPAARAPRPAAPVPVVLAPAPIRTPVSARGLALAARTAAIPATARPGAPPGR